MIVIVVAIATMLDYHNLLVMSVRLVNDGLVFFQRQRWYVDHLSIGSERAGARGIGIAAALALAAGLAFLRRRLAARR